jgi:hypothetical protein
MRQMRYAEAEPLLLKGNESIKAGAQAIPAAGRI